MSISCRAACRMTLRCDWRLALTLRGSGRRCKGTPGYGPEAQCRARRAVCGLLPRSRRTVAFACRRFQLLQLSIIPFSLRDEPIAECDDLGQIRGRLWAN